MKHIPKRVAMAIGSASGKIFEVVEAPDAGIPSMLPSCSSKDLPEWIPYVQESELKKMEALVRIYDLFLKACEGEDTAIDRLGIRHFAHPQGVKKVRQMILDAMNTSP